MLPVIPHVLPVVGAIITAGSRPATTLESACGHDPGIACRLIWDVTHDGNAAELTRVYLAGPVTVTLRIAFVLALALAIRAVTHRTIKRIARHAADSEADGTPAAACPGARLHPAQCHVGGHLRHRRHHHRW
jgi:hypothetical protein